MPPEKRGSELLAAVQTVATSLRSMDEIEGALFECTGFPMFMSSSFSVDSFGCLLFFCMCSAFPHTAWNTHTASDLLVPRTLMPPSQCSSVCTQVHLVLLGCRSSAQHHRATWPAPQDWWFVIPREHHAVVHSGARPERGAQACTVLPHHHKAHPCGLYKPCPGVVPLTTLSHILVQLSSEFAAMSVPETLSFYSLKGRIEQKSFWDTPRWILMLSFHFIGTWSLLGS